MTTLFISDLHLDDARPQITHLFERFMASDMVRDADALYILGDLVEAWVGDDDDAELPQRIAHATLAVRDAGTPVYFMAGNRDFLLGRDYAARAGFEMLDEGTVHDLYGTPTLLMHGDLLCTDDVEYQNARRTMRSDAWQQQILSMPLEQRRGVAAQAREQSKAHTGSAMDTIMDVNQDAVEEAMTAANVQRLIHGHTHRPGQHDFTLHGQAARRIVLGDWYARGSVLRLAETTCELDGLLPTSADT